MRRSLKLLLPIIVLISVLALSVVGSGRRSNNGELSNLNRAGAVEVAEPAVYLDALGIIPPTEDIEAIDFTVTTLNGKTEQLSDHEGKVIFLNFWATWCGPCRAEVKDIDSLYGTLKEEEFMVMALSIQEEKKKVSKFMKNFDIDFPVYLDSDGAVATKYGVTGIPTTYIIAPDGKIVGRAIGPREWASQDSIDLMRSLMN
jgi:peroxiredoxin